MSLSKHKSHNHPTVQMVCWLSSVSFKLSAPVQILRAPIFVLSFLNSLFSPQTDARNVCLHVFELFRLRYYD